MAQMAARLNAGPATSKLERSAPGRPTVTRWDPHLSTQRQEARMRALATTEGRPTRMVLRIRANQVSRWLMAAHLHLCEMYPYHDSKATFNQNLPVAKRPAIRAVLRVRPRNSTPMASRSRNRGRNALQSKLRKFQSSSESRAWQNRRLKPHKTLASRLVLLSATMKERKMRLTTRETLTVRSKRSRRILGLVLVLQRRKARRQSRPRPRRLRIRKRKFSTV